MERTCRPNNWISFFLNSLVLYFWCRTIWVNITLNKSIEDDGKVFRSAQPRSHFFIFLLFIFKKPEPEQQKNEMKGKEAIRNLFAYACDTWMHKNLNDVIYFNNERIKNIELFSTSSYSYYYYFCLWALLVLLNLSVKYTECDHLSFLAIAIYSQQLNKAKWKKKKKITNKVLRVQRPQRLPFRLSTVPIPLAFTELKKEWRKWWAYRMNFIHIHSISFNIAIKEALPFHLWVHFYRQFIINHVPCLQFTKKKKKILQFASAAVWVHAHSILLYHCNEYFIMYKL